MRPLRRINSAYPRVQKIAAQIRAADLTATMASERIRSALTLANRGIVHRYPCHREYSRRLPIDGTLMRYFSSARAKTTLTQRIV